MTGFGKHIFPGTGFADQQQRGVHFCHALRLFNHVAHFGAFRHQIIKTAGMHHLHTAFLPADTLTDRAQQHNRADRGRGIIFFIKVNRRHTQRVRTPLEADGFFVRRGFIILNPAGEVELAEIIGDVTLADTLFGGGKQGECRAVGQFNIPAQVER